MHPVAAFNCVRHCLASHAALGTNGRTTPALVWLLYLGARVNCSAMLHQCGLLPFFVTALHAVHVCHHELTHSRNANAIPPRGYCKQCLHSSAACACMSSVHVALCQQEVPQIFCCLLRSRDIKCRSTACNASRRRSCAALSCCSQGQGQPAPPCDCKCTMHRCVQLPCCAVTPLHDTVYDRAALHVDNVQHDCRCSPTESYRHS